MHLGVRFGLGCLVAVLVAGCSASTATPIEHPLPDAGHSDAGIPDAGAPDSGAPGGGLPDAGALPDAGVHRDAGTDAGVACLQGETGALLSCLRNGESPDDCVDSVAGPLCDSDGDGVGDDLELALAYEYAPVFAFNAGAYGGNAETNWPANVNHFVTHAQLFYRPLDGGSDLLVDAAPTLASLPDEIYSTGGSAWRANDPSVPAGSAFFLCLTDTTGSTGVRVTSEDAMLALPDGVDLTTVVQPANGVLANSTHLMIAYDLFFAYNQFATVDNHEGDWEGIIVFVNRMTGGLDSAFFGRHGSTDDTAFVDNATYPPRDAAGAEPSRGTNVDHSDPSIHGLRFVDFNGLRHHLVAFVSTGSHAMYDYPANTYIFNPAPRDTHDGDGPWLNTAKGQLGSNGGASQSVHLVWHNPGELGHVQVPWAKYRGQWGCQNEVVAQSWPGPWGNERHERPELDRAWGSPPTTWP